MKRLGKVKTLAIAALATVALATPIALAQKAGTDQGRDHGQHGERRGGDGERGGGFGGRMFEGLNLTDAQKAQIKQLHQSFDDNTKALREQLRAKHEELRQAEAGGTFNEALATQKLTEAASLEAKLMGAEFNLRQQTLSVLTPEQKAQLDARRAQMKQRHDQKNQTPQQ